jgi:hypothetical protein
MGIYTVKSRTCHCCGQWSTLDPQDHRIYMHQPCSTHECTEGNRIYYKLHYMLEYITRPQSNANPYKDTYLVKVLEKQQIKNKHGYGHIIKIELTDNGAINADNFVQSKQTYFSDMDDAPMWKRIDDNTIQFVLIYQSVHHTVEHEWVPADY